jgi:pantoate--beta-alanine ligase
MWIGRTILETRELRRTLRGTVAFVPTMGALHAGHVSLIEAAREHGAHVLVSVFVNPTQFGPNEDLSKYPRPLERDLELCEKAGAAGVFVPNVEEMFPGVRVGCDVTVPALAGVLEGAVRPGHFAGVCRVVAKLFNIVQPNVSLFGMKDYQQFRVIETMVRDLDMPVKIVGRPTVRENDGLAMSSRNVYMNVGMRARAIGLFAGLTAAKRMVEQEGVRDRAAIEGVMRREMESRGIMPDYAVVRERSALRETGAQVVGEAVALVAGRLTDAGVSVRLLDNMEVFAA